MKKWRLNTRIVHAGEKHCPITGAHRVPIYQTSTFVFDNPEQGARRFSGEEDGYIYTRLGNPTQTALETKMADIEGGEAAAATASGMSAVANAVLAFLKKGDHLISSRAVYGCTHSLFKEFLPRWGIETTFVDTSEISNIQNSIKPNTRIIYIETPANPTMKLVDIESVSDLAHKHDCLTICDNTFPSPIFQQPLKLGVDLVVHSATKYIGGHGDTIAGIIVGNKEDLDVIKGTTLKDFGGVISPFNAWLLLRGVKTLALRMERINNSAIKVANFLSTHPAIEIVHFPGLPSHPQHQLARKQMQGYGGMISFELKEGLEAGKKLLKNLELCTLAVSLGDVDTLIEHPASMTHSPLAPEDRIAAGITDGLIRISIGIEDVDDIIDDLKSGLAGI